MDLPGPEPDDLSHTTDESAAPSAPEAPSTPVTEPDLERIAGDLADIEQALDRLSDGSYWSDEITGESIPDEVLAEDPTARRVAYVRASQETAAPTDAPGEPVDSGEPPTVR
jgi:RNA polymerase-binding transcription factor DksA